MAEQSSVLTDRLAGWKAVAGLARMFPGGLPVRIPVTLVRDSGEREQTSLEYGTQREVVFVASMGLECDETLTLQCADGAFTVRAEVVALQMAGGVTAVAARFKHPVPNWIVKS